MIYSSAPFDELICSWNGLRPRFSTWTFWVRIEEDEWLKYAEWGPNFQRTFHSKGRFSESYQDTIVTNRLCTTFQIRVEGAELEKLQELRPFTCSMRAFPPPLSPSPLPSVFLSQVPFQSQRVLSHPRHKDLCSPTATTTALRYLLRQFVDPVDFADRVRDHGFDIYGNWILNIAEAFHRLRSPCYVTRLPSFAALHAKLQEGKPVVVSVKGPLPGAPLPYQSGHLLCVVGYEGEKVYCIDSAFSDNESTYVSYPLADFLAAWGLRRHLAYVFV